MSLNIISRKFYDDQNRNVNFLLGNANNLVKAVYQVQIEYKVVLSASVGLLVNDTTLTLTNGTWEDYGFVAGTNYLSVNINGHSATKTINLIDDADMIIDSTFSPSIPNDTYSVGTLTCLCPTEGMNVAFNFCKNSLSSEFSLIDGEANRWSVDGLHTLSVGSTLSMSRLGNKSGLPQVNTATIKKIDDSPLIFEVTIETYISPFHNNTAYFAGESLASFARFDALPVFNNLNVKLSRTDKYNGNVGYFNENFNGFAPNFTKDSITWQNDDADVLEAMDYSQPSNFEIRVNGAFTSGSKFQFIAFFPSNEPNDYSNLTSDASKNFISTVETTAKAVDTDYNVTTATHPSGASVTFENVRMEQFTTYALITGRAVPNSAFTDLMELRGSANRSYRIWVRCENPALDYNSSDMVNVECDNATLMKMSVPLGEYDITDSIVDHKGSELPLANDTDKDLYSVITEDDIRRDSTFKIPRNASEFQEIAVVSRARNITTGESFELERFVCNLNALPMLPNGSKPINTVINRPFNIAFSSQMTQIKFLRLEALDDTEYYGVRVIYPLLLRWEYWLQQLNASDDFFGSKTKNWFTYQTTDWRVENAIIITTDEGQYVNPLGTVIRDYDDADIDYTFEFFTLDDTPITAPLNEVVKVRVTHEVSGVSECWGQISVEPKENAPRWLISTEYAQINPEYPLQPLSGETALKTTINADNVQFECLFDGRLLDRVKFTSRLQTLGDCEADCVRVSFTLDGVSYTYDVPKVGEENGKNRYELESVLTITWFSDLSMFVLYYYSGAGSSEYTNPTDSEFPYFTDWTFNGGDLELDNLITEPCCSPSLSHRVKEEYKIARVPKTFTPENRGFADCGCVPFLTLVDPTDTARERNDVNSAWGQGEDVTFELKKNGVTTNFTPIVTPFPNETDAFYTTIEWRDVYALDGNGCFELYVTETYAGLTNTRLWGKYQLAVYSTQLASGTVRLLSYFNDVNSSIGINFTGAFVKDTLRLKGKFGYWNDKTEVDNIQYTDAERMKVKREDVTEYELRVDLHTECYIERLRFHLLSENACYITDHNADNYTYKYIDLPVIVMEGFTPEWIEGTRQVKGIAKFQDKQKLKRTHFQDNENPGNFIPPQSAFVPASIIDGETTVQVGSGQTYTCSGSASPITVSNSNDTYSEETSTDLVLPDTTVNVYVDGVLNQTGTIVTLDPNLVINITA